ncbi:MAG: hypothetical protein H7Y88_02280 [Phycisphaerales bacterium]|nr:hypothetical protein [Phycisphaerales bacterium]
MPPLTVADLVLIVAGAGLAIAGLRTIRFERGAFGRSLQGASVLSATERRLVSSLSTPTRMSVGVVLLVTGYHLIVWALPTHYTEVRVPRERWYVLVTIALLWVGGSIVLDRRHRGHADQPPHTGERG